MVTVPLFGTDEGERFKPRRCKFVVSGRVRGRCVHKNLARLLLSIVSVPGECQVFVNLWPTPLQEFPKLTIEDSGRGIRLKQHRSQRGTGRFWDMKVIKTAASVENPHGR